MPADYSDFRVLIDDPAASPQLGFAEYAVALSDIIRHSTPEFAIGIFGSWGTGKTTLMRQIERELSHDQTVICAWFTAWRYEREAHLIIPLVDVLREALEARATSERQPGPARRAAGLLRRAGRAFLAGLTVSAQLPGLQLQLDPGEVVAQIRDDAEPQDTTLSSYHAAFVMLREAIQIYSDFGARRVVIFVDDLDRCLPANALDVLESMKLFFDVQGCVFVVGLDQTVAERAVAQKYAVPSAGPASAELSPVSGVEYLKKIFQVPFALPRVGTNQLREYCWAVMESASLPPGQVEDFRRTVAPHLDFLPDQDSVNPREIKRLINAYVLQIKMLSLRLRGDLQPTVVLALQIMSFRRDWRDLYDALAADPVVVQQTLRDAVRNGPGQDQVWLSGRTVSLPRQLARYLRGPAERLLDDRFLVSYVSAVESSRTSDPTLLEAQAAINRLRLDLATADRPGAPGPISIQPGLSRLTELLHRRSDQPQLNRLARDLEAGINQFLDAEMDAGGLPPETIASSRALLDDVEVELRELRRQSDLGAFS